MDLTIIGFLALVFIGLSVAVVFGIERYRLAHQHPAAVPAH